MNEVTEKTESKEVVKGNSNDFVKKAEAVDKKPVAKRATKPTNKKPAAKTENKPDSDKKEPPKKKPLTRAQIAEKKYGVESTWRPFEIFFNKQKEKAEQAKK